MPETAARDPAIAAVLRLPFPQQIAFFRGKLGTLVPTAKWTDMLGSAHDRAFMVAGAADADLLAGLAAAVDKAIAAGGSIEDFRRDFAALVEKSGWDYRGEFNWRTRTIYQTNLSTSYAAGRYEQLQAFPFWMYKHGDSLVPRPHHLAWDGIVLPRDHEFWKTHFAPNDWGCTCRVVGLMKPEDARALGGDPDKQLPENWQNIDPKTGAPIGIGKGWDYAPGATVHETVAALAAKTQQWEYSIAKAFMQGVPESVRDSLAAAYRDLPSVANDTRLYAQGVLEGRAAETIPPYRTLGLVTTDQAARIKELIGKDVGLFDFAIDRNAPLHVQKRHGDEDVEAGKRQRAIEADDYATIPAVLNDPDRIWADRGLIVIDKRIGEELIRLIFDALSRRRMVNLVSMRIYSGSGAPSR